MTNPAAQPPGSAGPTTGQPRKLLFSVNVPILAIVSFSTMATSREEAKADVCRRLAERDVHETMFSYWEQADSEPDYEVQWDSISAWLSASYMMNEQTRAELTEDEWKEHGAILYPAGDPNLNTDKAKQIAMMLNDSIQRSNEYLLTIAKKIDNQDFAWLAAIAAQTMRMRTS